jgi:predicted nucleic acid-binding Zn ribbon protein
MTEKNNYGKFYLIPIMVLLGLLVSCNPIHRFNRLVECYPYLLDSVKHSEVIVDSGKVVDTAFIVQTQVDTFVVNGVRIERIRDTFRIIYRERNCTTTVNKTEVRPTKVIEREIRQEIQKEQKRKGIMYALYLALAIIFVSLLIKLFK